MNGRIYELMITVITNITNTVLGAWYDLIGLLRCSSTSHLFTLLIGPAN
jgi:hypothetical protein